MEVKFWSVDREGDEIVLTAPDDTEVRFSLDEAKVVGQMLLDEAEEE